MLLKNKNKTKTQKQKFKNKNAKTKQAIEADVKAEVDEAVKFALESPYPPISNTYTDILVEEVPVRAVELQNTYYPPSAAK